MEEPFLHRRVNSKTSLNHTWQDIQIIAENKLKIFRMRIIDKFLLIGRSLSTQLGSFYVLASLFCVGCQISFKPSFPPQVHDIINELRLSDTEKLIEFSSHKSSWMETDFDKAPWDLRWFWHMWLSLRMQLIVLLHSVFSTLESIVSRSLSGSEEEKIEKESNMHEWM